MERETLGRLQGLPRWALVAYGARCARWANTYENVRLDDPKNRSINQAVSLAEQSALRAERLSTLGVVSECEALARREWDEVSNAGDETDYARQFAAPAAVAALAARLVEDPNPRLVVQMLREIDFLASGKASELHAELVQLGESAVAGSWGPNTPVSAHSFAVPFDTSVRVQAVVRHLSDHLARLVAEDPSALDHIEWRDLERLLEVALSIFGDVELTPGSKDGGFDLRIRSGSDGEWQDYLIEVKHWRSHKKVGARELSKFVHVVARERGANGLFLATYGFGATEVEAIAEVESPAIYLGERDHVASLCRSYMRSINGLWLPSENLASLLHRDFERLAFH